MTVKQLLQALMMLRDGDSIRKVSSHFGVSDATLQSHIKRGFGMSVSSIKRKAAREAEGLNVRWPTKEDRLIRDNAIRDVAHMFTKESLCEIFNVPEYIVDKALM